MPKTRFWLLLTIGLVSTCAHANETLWKAVTEGRWLDVERICREDPSVNLGFAPPGEQSVEWYIKMAGRDDILNMKRIVFGGVPLPRRASLNDANSPPKEEEVLLALRAPVRFKSRDYIDRAEEGEVVTVLRDPTSPRNSLRIMKKSGEVGLVPKSVLCLTSDDVTRLEKLIEQYPIEVCSALRQNQVVVSALRSLFKSEFSRNRQRGLDSESLRSYTPAIALCTSLLQSPSVCTFQEGLGRAIKKKKECLQFCLQADYPSEIIVILKALKSVLSPEVCSIPAPQMMKSVFGVRFLSPMLVNLNNVGRAKDMQAIANCETRNQLDVVVERILGMPTEDLDVLQAQCSNADIQALNEIIALLKTLAKDY